MNLFSEPSLNDLSILIASCSNMQNNYNLFVDYDGEVQIILSSEKSKKSLRKYKFYFSELNGKMNVGIIASKNLRYLNQLYKNLIYCWDSNLKGEIDSDAITALQTINYWLEINKITSQGRKKDNIQVLKQGYKGRSHAAM